MAPAEKPGRPGARMPELVEMMQRLLGPGGCPWDRTQTLASLRPYLLEETHELIEAMEHGGAAEHREELGDLLLQIVFQAALRQAEGAFDIDDVIAGIAAKLTRRHPHVFGDATATSAEDVHATWQEIKAKEKQAAGSAPRSRLAGVPATLPALARAQKLGERAARAGFDAPGAAAYRDKLREELDELDQAMDAADPAAIEAELGDVLFTVVNLARKLGCDAESALRQTSHRFCARFSHIEDALAAQGRAPESATLEELDALWDQAKGAEPARHAASPAARPGERP